jgi:hypothetical protein
MKNPIRNCRYRDAFSSEIVTNDLEFEGEEEHAD